MEYLTDDQVFRVKDLPEDQRPREKAQKQGIETLSDAELLALLLGSGTRRMNAVQLAVSLLKRYGDIFELSRQERQILQQNRGIGPAKAIHLLAAFEFARRINIHRVEGKIRISSPTDAFNHYRHRFAYLKNEVLTLLILNTRNEVTAVEEISSGLVNATAAHPREIFNKAVSHLATAIILVHNHPSQNPAPSKADIELTKKVADAGKILEIPLLDHVIITLNEYYSLKSEGDF